jgi:hypothetical protein
MHWNLTVHLRTSATRPRERDDLDVMTAPNKFMSEHAHV